MNEEEIKAVIRCIHEIWYNDDWLSDPETVLKMHNHMCALFDFAGITSTLVKK
jgi:hypothetical protein